ncbi:MAG: FMN-binding protein, partial [Lachnospirales bacterium]
MKFKKALSLFLSGTMIISSFSFNVLADNSNFYDTEKIMLYDNVVSGGAVDSIINTVKLGSLETEFYPGSYDIPVSLMKSGDITSPSLAGSCVDSGVLNVANDGTATITVNLKEVSVMGISEWTKQWSIYSNGLGSEKFIPEYTTNPEGEIDSITFEILDTTVDGVYVNMYIGAMQSYQDAYLAFNYVNSNEETSIYTGTAHVDQFGGYDVNVWVTVKGGIITDIVVEGDNFNGSYADVNKSKLQKAFEGLKNIIIGKSSTDANGINDIDAVTSATISSNAIKEAVMNALSIAVSDEVINIPTEKLLEGEYSVDIAFYTDNVDHSLVENEKIKAIIKV